MPFGATTRTICGTPEFMAPEILEEQPYDRAVDWWAYGVLMYEMLLGRAPFSGEEEDDIYDSILEDEPLYPPTIGRHEQALLQSVRTLVNMQFYFIFEQILTYFFVKNSHLTIASGQSAKSSFGSRPVRRGRDQGTCVL